MMRPARTNRALLAALVALHLAALMGVASIEWSGDLRSRFLPEDPAGEAMQLESSLFGDEHAFFVLAESDQLLDRAEMRDAISRWTEQLGRISGVARVWSPYDLPALARDANGDLHIVTVAETPDPLHVLATHPLAGETMLRRDGRGFALTIVPEKSATATFAARRALVSAVENWARRASGHTYRLTLAGALPFEVSCLELAFGEARWITAFVLAVSIAVLAAAFRSLAAALVILAVGGVNAASTFGAAGLVAAHLSQFNLYVVPVVLTISLLDNVHITHAYCRAREDGLGAAEAAATAMRAMRFPCVMTSLTTAAGFSVLLTSHVPQVRQFGVLAAAGTLIALASSLILLPPILARVDPRRRGSTARTAGGVAFLVPARAILVVAGIMMLAALPGALRLHLVPEYPRLLTDDHPWMVEMDRIEQAWGGIGRVSFLLGKRAEEPAEDLDPIELLGNFSRLLLARPLVTSVTSPVDVLRYARRVARADTREAGHQNDPPSLLRALLSKEEGEQLDEALAAWVSRDSNWLRIIARVRVMQPEKFPALVRDLEGFQRTLSELFDVRLSGWVLLYKNLETELLAEMTRSFMLAFALVGLLLFFVARSMVWWLIAVAVNLFPLWVVLGLLGWTGHGFSSGLLLAPGMALGLVVDDTIHVVHAWRAALTSGDTDRALRAAVDRTFLPVTVTSVLLAIGFAVMGLSAFRANRDFGLVMAAVVLLAWAADVVILPALARVVAARGK
ncbi:MAG: hypothetical protein D6760_13760 [Deltaproteobacteria bacterium]|nr:MAG: hypothetical protein D6760_13760 [Deltaproteobacteria bacterium]